MAVSGDAAGSSSQDPRPEWLDIAPEYLHTLVHQLRDPLAPMRNATEVLRQRSTDPQQVRCVEILNRQIAILARRLDDLNAVFQGPPCELVFNESSVDLAHVLAAATQGIEGISDADLQCSAVALQKGRIFLRCDPLRLAQAVGAVVRQAVQRTCPGEAINLTADAQKDQIQIEVQRCGAKWSLEEVGELLESPSTSSPRANTRDGVDLAAARRTIQLHGGSMDARGEVEGAGRLIIRLPATTETLSDSFAFVHRHGKPRRIMVIDDHEDSATSLCQVFAAAGHSVLAARTGELGLALAEGFHPEAVIIDLALPGMDGFEVGRCMRERTVTARALLIAVTGFSMKRFRDVAAYSVFRHYLLKPACPDTLLQVIENTLEDAESGTAG